TPNSDSGFIDIWIISDDFCCINLVFYLVFSEFFVSTFFKFCSFKARSSSVNCYNNISFLGEHIMKIIIRAVPSIIYLLRTRTRILVHQNRIFFVWIKILWFDYPGIKFMTFFGNEFEELFFG